MSLFFPSIFFIFPDVSVLNEHNAHVKMICLGVYTSFLLIGHNQRHRIS